MGLFDQISNKVSYAVHQATYDPEAETYAKKQAAAKKAAEDAAAAEIEAKKRADVKAAADAKAAKEKAEAEQKELERENFEVGRMFGRVFGTAGTILGIFLLVVLGVYGASLATNLNIYRNVWYRILYAIYGFVGFFIVIPYVLLYRWWWLGKKPRFYSLIPLVPYHLDNRWAQLLFRWISFKPDDQMEALKEWEHERGL